jgi:hypothetical protein
MIMSLGRFGRSTLILALVGGGAWSVVAPEAVRAAEPLGRLFLAPDVRAMLEVRRQAKAPTAVVAPAEKEEVEEPVASYLTVDGQIQRSNGAQTIFINGVPYSAPDAPRGTQIAPGKRVGEVLVVPTEGAAAVRLKVGQALDKNSLAIDDALQRSGTITIGKTPAKGSAAGK